MALGDAMVGGPGATSDVEDLWGVGTLAEMMSGHHLPDHSTTLLVDSCLQVFLGTH